jgi:signal recognition particle GTPase
MMRKEYDFSKGVRGKFFRAGASLKIPVYLEKDNLKFVQSIAKKKGSDASSVVNRMIRFDKELAKAF